MRKWIIAAAVLAIGTPVLSGCNLTAHQIASATCVGAEVGSQVAVIVTTESTLGGPKAADASAKAQSTANKACPIIVAGVDAVQAAAVAK